MLYFKLYPFTLLKHLVVSHSYLCIWVNCCSIISQVIIYLKLLKRWISILNLALFSSTLPVALLVVDLPPSHSLLLWFDLPRTSSRSARCSLVSISINTLSYSAHSWLVSVSIFLPLFCPTPRVALLVVYLFPSQSLPLWFAQHLELICSLLTCLDSRLVLTVCFNLLCFVLKPLPVLLAVQLSLAAI